MPAVIRNRPALLGPGAQTNWAKIGQALWETNLMAPVRGAYNLMNADPYTLYTDTGAAGQQAAADSFDAGTGVMVGSMPASKPADALTMGIKAYHGSPHSFEKFDMSKIGTGEGAQAYGHGLYFAENEGVAKGYRDTLAPAPTAAQEAAQRGLDAHGGDANAAADEIANMIKDGNLLPETIDHYKSVEAILRGEASAKPGHVYEVSINADPNAFLDWDKPFANQDEVERFAAKFDAVNPSIRKRIEDWGYERERAGQPMPDGNDLVREVFGGIGSKEAVRGAEMMKEAGIPGIKYLDAGSRGKGVAHVQPMYKGQPYGDPIPATAWNQVDQLTQRYKDMGYDVEVQDLGTRNYVVFDDKLISIVKKYGIAGASAMLGYDVMTGANKAQAADLKKAEAQYQGSNMGRSGW